MHINMHNNKRKNTHTQHNTMHNNHTMITRIISINHDSTIMMILFCQ